MCDPRAVACWGQADIYVGGIEIAVPIMLYGSFVTKALRDAGCVDFSLPCRALLAHDMVLKDGKKMSKSLGNAVDPDDLITEVGADTVRFFILSLAPPLKKIDWSDERLRGCHKFLRRVWNLGLRHAAQHRRRTGSDPPQPTEAERTLMRRTHDTIRAVTMDLDRLRPNTCLTALIKFAYALEELETTAVDGRVTLGERPVFHAAIRTLLQLLAPFTPHLCAELWERIGMAPSLSEVSWPSYDPALPYSVRRSLAVKVDGELVARLEIAAGVSADEALSMAYEHAAVKERLGHGRASRAVYVKDQMINLVT